MWWLGGVAFGLLGVWAIRIYNLLVALQQRVDGAWSDIDAQLKRRHDLVPSLVETVKGYAAHERDTLERVTARRSDAVAASRDATVSDRRAGQENLLVESIRGLFALAEAYPQLRASENFAGLQQQLAEIEEHLQKARRYYNAVVRDFNVGQRRFPNLMISRVLGFGPRDFFELDSSLERHNIVVDLDPDEA